MNKKRPSTAGAGEQQEERRKKPAPRAHKRLMVRYGVNAPEKTAFTQNLSTTGMYLRTQSVENPGTVLQISVETPEGTFDLTARVAWIKKVPPQLAYTVGFGMGIEFRDPPEPWAEFTKRWSSRK